MKLWYLLTTELEIQYFWRPYVDGKMIFTGY